MSRLYAKPCVLDKDYARFARFYIAHCNQFHEHYSLYDAIAHIFSSIHDSRLLLFNDEQGGLAGYTHYRYEKDKAAVFIDSAILLSAYRSSRVFYRGFVDLVMQIMEESSEIRLVRFHAHANQAYLNRLYGKFARRTGEREGDNGLEYVYETEFADLLRYLRVDEPISVHAHA